MADVDGPMLAIKKLSGLLFVLFGLLGVALGYAYNSLPLIVLGVVALIAGATLLALKVIRRNPG